MVQDRAVELRRHGLSPANMTRRTVIILPAQRLGLSREEAADYIGVSTSLFDIMVADGRMPPPKRVNSRRIWDRRRLEAAFTALPGDEDFSQGDGIDLGGEQSSNSVPDPSNGPLAKYYAKIGVDPKTMGDADLMRLQEEADAAWRDSIPGMSLNVRERKALLQFRDYGPGVLVKHDKIKGMGCDTGDRLSARGFVEMRPNPKWPDRIGGYVLTPTGFEAMKTLLEESPKD